MQIYRSYFTTGKDVPDIIIRDDPISNTVSEPVVEILTGDGGYESVYHNSDLGKCIEYVFKHYIS